jgi:two-component system chemotaxis response regulator CheB
VLFRSVARLGASAVGVILTGMGSDGASGLLAMREAGARTFGQNAATCVVYGMPRAAFERGAVEREVSLSAMPEAILAACRK